MSRYWEVFAGFIGFESWPLVVQILGVAVGGLGLIVVGWIALQFITGMVWPWVRLVMLLIGKVLGVSFDWLWELTTKSEALSRKLEKKLDL